MTYIAELSDRRMSVGRVFSRAFGAIGALPAQMFGTAFLFGALPGLLMNLGVKSARLGQDTAFAPSTIAVSVGIVILSIAFSILAQGALVRVTVAHSDGQPVAFVASALASARKIIPLFLLAMLIAIAIGFASLLFLVPGILLYVMWSVAAPVLVAEDRGVSAALGRSAALTKGARWNVFAIQLIMLLIYYAIAALSGLVSVLAFGGFQQMVAASSAGMDVSSFLVIVFSSGIFGTLTLTVMAAIQTALYVELRNWKEGPASAALGDIFG